MIASGILQGTGTLYTLRYSLQHVQHLPENTDDEIVTKYK